MTISRWLGMSKSRTNFRYFLLILLQSPIIISSGTSPNRGCFCTSVDFSSKTLCKLFKPQKSSGKEFHRSDTLHEEPSPLLFSFWLHLMLPTSWTGKDLNNWSSDMCVLHKSVDLYRIAPKSPLFPSAEPWPHSSLDPHTFLSFLEIPLILYVTFLVCLLVWLHPLRWKDQKCL